MTGSLRAVTRTQGPKVFPRLPVPARHALAGVGVLGALAVRWPLFPFESRDYQQFLSMWWDTIRDRGGFAALQSWFSDYNPPYLYLLAASSYLDPWVRDLTAIKGISVFFDFLLAFFVFLSVRLRYSAPSLLPTGAALAVLFAPTVVMNSAAWGQADSIYTSFLAGTLFFLLAGRRAWAFVFFGLAFSFKLQAVFFAPVLLWLLAKREARWREALLSPLVYLLSLVPVWWIGRPLSELFSIYIYQLGASRELFHNAPTLYNWIPQAYADLAPAFVGAAAVTLLLVTDFLMKSRRPIGERLTLLATFAILLTPSLLPHMRERYFYPAETLSIVFVFFYPRYWFVPVGLWSVSTCTYTFYLWRKVLVPLEWLPLALLAVLVALGLRVFREFRNRPSSPRVASEDIVPARRRRPVAVLRGLTWCAIVLLIAASAAYGRYRILLQRTVEERIEAAGAPVTTFPWAVYLEERPGSSNILYHRPGCYGDESRFVLHLYPEDAGRLAPARRRYGFSIHNFDFREREVSWARNCMASVPLPDYPLSSIVTGQTRRRDDGSPQFTWLYRLRPPGAAPRPSDEAADGRFEGPLDPDRYRTPLSALAAGNWGAQVARSRFDLYFDGAALRYYKRPCAAAEVTKHFFLHLARSGVAHSGGPMVRDFDFYDYGTIEDGECLALVPLPDGYAKFDTGQWTMPSWRVEGRLDRARYRAALRSLDRGEWDAPAVRAYFDLWLTEDEIHYVREPCEPRDTEARFFLHLYGPEMDTPGDLDFRNRDFDFGEHGVIEDGRCLALVPLPDAPIQRIATGQFVSGEPAIWRADLWPEKERLERLLQSIASGRHGTPAARSTFDLYLDGTALLFHRPTCSTSDLGGEFFLRLYPENEADLPAARKGYDFENRDFAFLDQGFLSDGACVARVPLPDYPIARLRAGQFHPGGEPSWTAEVRPGSPETTR